MSKIVLRWATLSLLVLVNSLLVAAAVVLVLGRRIVGPSMGRGPSVSEWTSPYFFLLGTSGLVGLAALVLVALFWVCAARWLPEIGSPGAPHRIVQVSLMAAPVWFAVLYLAGALLRQNQAGP